MIFGIASTSIKIILEIVLLFISNADMVFADYEFIKKFYTIIKILLTIY